MNRDDVERAQRRLEIECDAEWGRAARIAEAIDRSENLVSKVRRRRKKMSADLYHRLMKMWAADDGRLHTVAQLPNHDRVPPSGTLAEAVVMRAGVWSRETVQALQRVAETHAACGMRCTTGQWIDAGDRLERDAGSDDSTATG